MNKFAKRMIMEKMRDGRNPYGSRGGYVTSRRDDNYPMGRTYEDGRQGVKGTGKYGMGGSKYYGRDMAENEYDYRDYGYGYGVGMFDYDTEDYNYMSRDYGSEMMGRLTSKDLKKWERHLENADGTTGKKYDVDQIRQVAQQMGVHFDEYSPELLTAITNMMYSDYCKIHGNDLMSYVKMARAFLDDDDFDGTPEEKAYLYYKCIVEKE